MYEFRPCGTGIFDAYLNTSLGAFRLGTVLGWAGRWTAELPRSGVIGTFRTKAQAAQALQQRKFPRGLPT